MTSQRAEVHDTHAGQQQANDITDCQHGIWAAILPDFRFATAARRSHASLIVRSSEDDQ
jgi:hypothetical protein